jgi:ABC-2 type transport system ATP-binding protein
VGAIIKAVGLTKDYKVYDRKAGLWGSLTTLFSSEHRVVRAVDNISFEIEPGAKVAYIGPNGAGKSTTIKILTGILTPSAGYCEVAGVIPHRDRVRNARNIGVVFGQRTQLWWDLPVIDSFTILRRIYDIPDAVFHRNMRMFRSLLGIDELAPIPVRKLSLGQRMRIEIAVSFLHDPQVVFLDEPTIGLDAVLKVAIRDLINDMNARNGTTIVLTSHDMDDIREICDDVVLIDKSRIVFQGTLASLAAVEERRSVILDFHCTPTANDAVTHMARRLAGIIQVDREGANRIRVQFDRDRLSIQDLTSYLFRNLEVADFYCVEPRLEEVIRRLYKEGMDKRAAA